MEKTAVVLVKRQVPHPKYKKNITVTTKYLAHNELEDVTVGTVVRIENSARKLSARKRFVVAEICPQDGCMSN
jgi:small subunit ribosomal protein S17